MPNLVATYRENRAALPLEELEKHDGKWVAFAEDGSQIVASAVELGDLIAQLEAAGEDPQDFVFERIELNAGESFVGSVETEWL